MLRRVALVSFLALAAGAGFVGCGQIGEEPTDSGSEDANEVDCGDGVDDDDDGDVDCDDADCADAAECTDSGL